MKSSTLLSGLAILGSAIAHPFANNEPSDDKGRALPACSNKDIGPCACPNGTVFQSSKTYAVVGANAKDFKNLFGDFYNTSWLSATLESSQGPDNTVGSNRTITSGSDVGTYLFVEELIKFDTKPDGSFIQRFAQVNIPIVYAAHNGSFSGYWVTLDAKYSSPVETEIRWSAYACFTGHPIPFGTFRAGALKGAIAILQSKGLLKGENVAPVTVNSF